jgi:hypothetical protein
MHAAVNAVWLGMGILRSSNAHAAPFRAGQCRGRMQQGNMQHRLLLSLLLLLQLLADHHLPMVVIGALNFFDTHVCKAQRLSYNCFDNELHS